jgi:integrase/recombinase XerD
MNCQLTTANFLLKLHQFAEKLELLGYSKRSIAEYPMYVGYFFRYLETNEGVLSLDELTLQHITAYHTHLRFGSKEKGRVLASRTVSMRLIILKTFFRVMHAEKLIKNNLSSFITPATPPRTPPAYVPSEKEMSRLLNAITPDNPLSIRDRALFELLYATGMRNEEARNLTLERLDLSTRTVRVKGKGGMERIVPIGEWVVPYLMEYLHAVRPKLAVKGNNIVSASPGNLLFVSKNGRQLTKNSLAYLLRRYAAKAGLSISGMHPHILRHACATHLLRAGADIRYVQELLGHASLNSTQIYTKVEISFLQKAHRKYHPRERMREEGAK